MCCLFTRNIFAVIMYSWAVILFVIILNIQHKYSLTIKNSISTNNNNNNNNGTIVKIALKECKTRGVAINLKNPWGF